MKLHISCVLFSFVYLVCNSVSKSCLEDSKENWIFKESRDTRIRDISKEECEEKFLDVESRAFGYQYKEGDCFLYKSLFPESERECQNCVGKKCIDLPEACIQPIHPEYYEEDFIDLCITATNLCKNSYSEQKIQISKFDEVLTQMRTMQNDLQELKTEKQLKETREKRIDQLIMSQCSQNSSLPSGGITVCKHFEGNLYQFNRYEPREYMFTWDAARKKCQDSFGGHLTSITSFAELDFLRKNILEYNMHKERTRVVMIGGTRDRKGGRWTWVDGSEWFLPLPWELGQPNENNENRAGMDWRADGFHDCYVNKMGSSSFICKKKLVM